MDFLRCLFGFTQSTQIDKSDQINQIEGDTNLTIYVLELREGKYYVGKTKNAKRRLESHMSGSGSEWTKKYEPLKMLEQHDNCDEFDEDKYVLKMMSKYGIDNVRGGSFTQIRLTDVEMDFLKKRLVSASDLCFVCNSSEHFSKDCPTKLNTEKCFSCGLTGHIARNCPSVLSPRHVLSSEEHEKEMAEKAKYKSQFYCLECKSFSHDTVGCDVYNKSKQKVRSNDRPNDRCYACGKNGHYSYNCPYK